MPSPNIERKYVLTKVRAGDYFLPNNDGSRIYRLATYVDDVDISTPARTFWAVHVWPRSPQSLAHREGMMEDWEGWEFVEGGLSSRAEAIQVALRA